MKLMFFPHIKVKKGPSNPLISYFAIFLLWWNNFILIKVFYEINTSISSGTLDLLVSAIFVKTSLASSIRPWVTSHLGDSGVMKYVKYMIRQGAVQTTYKANFFQKGCFCIEGSSFCKVIIHFFAFSWTIFQNIFW